MKLILAFCLFLMGMSAQANDATYIRDLNFQACTFWQYYRLEGGGAYACSSYPQNVRAAEAYSTQAVVDQLEARIKALEDKVKSLESSR